MYKPEELEIVLGKALARWAAETGRREAIPPVWLREMAGMVKTYYQRLVDSNSFDVPTFEQDVYKLVTCFAPFPSTVNSRDLKDGS